ncbi:toprim domain-containing protein [Cereibacter sphaeroides]|uniref:Toprim domain-containing protein n=1 Tax=Cereibacter sphaeroides TaxID=1063 RepID=A0AAX1UNJ8_CERSP|nr:AAA family ATPase [Cereibacter sphaeroides]RHZ96475.1 toprim domain-containing protein [Cereibacter sphaeroides]
MDPMKWLADVRRLDPTMLEAMKVRPIQHPSIEGPAVAFPYIRRGEIYAAKMRGVAKHRANGSANFASTKGVTRGMFNEDCLRANETWPIVITEGEIDALSCIQAGYTRSVSVPDGWTEQGNKTGPILEAEEWLRKSPHVIVAGDSDKAGESLPREVSKILRGHDVRYVAWPDGCKDANDVLVKHGEGELAKCLLKAKRIDPPGGLITGFSDLPPLADRRVLRIGEKPFDWAVALELGAMSVWTGTPGSGKSTFLIWAAERITVSENIRCGVIAFETHPHDIRDQLALIRTGRDFRSLDSEAQANLEAALDERFRLVHVVLDDDQAQHLQWLESMIYALAVRDQCKLIIVDPWNELEHAPQPGESMTAYINAATKFLRQIAERLDIHIALVAHPRKMPTEGAPRPPNGYDIADSAAFFNKPSLGVTIHQAKHTDEDGEVRKWVEIHVWKVRKTRLYGFEKGNHKVGFDQDRMSYRRLDQ